MITLKRAIEVSTFLVTEKPDTISSNELDATKLGIEALKRCKYLREHTDRWAGILLPEETPEEET